MGKKQDLPVPLLHRIACAHLIDNVRGQTSPFEESQVKKARLSAEVTAVDGDVVSLRLEGQTRTAIEGRREHGLDMRLLGKATFDLAKGRFLTFELVAVGSRWGGTQLNGRRGDTDAAPIGILFTLAADSPCERRGSGVQPPCGVPPGRVGQVTTPARLGGEQGASEPARPSSTVSD